MLLFEKLNCTCFSGENWCPEIVVILLTVMCPPVTPVKTKSILLRLQVFSCDPFMLFYFFLIESLVFFVCFNCRCGSYQNPEDDLTKTQESHSNQKESPEVNSRWSKLSCSLPYLWVFFSYCSTGIFFFPFLNDESCKNTDCCLYLFLKNKCFIKIFA